MTDVLLAGSTGCLKGWRNGSAACKGWRDGETPPQDLFYFWNSFICMVNKVGKLRQAKCV